MPGLPQQDHADLGLNSDADHTEDLRPNSRTAPVDPVLAAPAGAVRNHRPIRKEIHR